MKTVPIPIKTSMGTANTWLATTMTAKPSPKSPTSSKPTSTNFDRSLTMSATKRCPPRDPIAPTAPPECEAWALGCDARNDFKAIDENPYDWPSLDWYQWADGWAEADRA